MQKIELELDDQTFKQARQLAELRHTTLGRMAKSNGRATGCRLVNNYIDCLGKRKSIYSAAYR